MTQTTKKISRAWFDFPGRISMSSILDLPGVVDDVKLSTAFSPIFPFLTFSE